MRITSWNVNSVRLRLDGLRQLSEAIDPDMLCLQETKTADETFPHAIADELGYPHRFIYGQKGYHGVAILSRIPFRRAERREWCNIAYARHAFVELVDSGVEVHNFYVPSGGDVPDPAVNDKFAHKLAFLAEITDWFAARRAEDNRFVLLGDLNIAPLETDVWSHKQLLDVVSHTPVEVAALDKLGATHGWIDAVREFVPADERLYSWWSYRARDWAKSDRGRRLDHVWVTPALRGSLRAASILREARGWPKPSDHVPVTLELAI